MSSLPAILTPSLLSSIRNTPNLPSNTWYLIAAATLTQLNRPDEVSKIYQHALNNGSDHAEYVLSYDEQLRVTRRLREALIKLTAIGGVPRTINALQELKKVTPQELLDEPEVTSPTNRRSEVFETPTSEILQRGQSFFDRLYGKVAPRVLRQMFQSGTEDLGLVAQLMYGYILSNTTLLSAAETSFVMIAGLIPQDVPLQLKGHLRGALNVGATVEQVRAVRKVAIEICEASGMRMLDSSSLAGFGWRSEIVDLKV